MQSTDESPQSDPARKSGAQQKQAATWLTPEQIERIRDACLTDAFPGYLQGRKIGESLAEVTETWLGEDREQRNPE